MSDMIFIKNYDDYINYKQLRPKVNYIYKKIRFICSNCHKEKIQTFKSLTEQLICKNCKCSIAQSSIITKEKKKQTYLNKYGIENPSQFSLFREKYKQTCLTRYGVEHPSQTNNFKENFKQTCLDKYGVENPSQSEEIKEKKRETCIKHFGVDSPGQNETIKEKMRNTCLKNYGVQYSTQNENVLKLREINNFKKYNKSSYNQTDEFKLKVQIKWDKKLHNRMTNYDLTILNKNKNTVKLLCNTCNHEFNISRTGFFHLLNTYTSNFCPKCSRIIQHGKSLKEKEFLDYLKTIYDKQILTNIRTIIHPKELDIYLPDLKIAFEFDGTYWHMDSRFYNENDIIKQTNLTAKEIWEKDKEKDLLCEQAGIKLIRIKEYDWINNQAKIKEYIKSLL